MFFNNNKIVIKNSECLNYEINIFEELFKNNLIYYYKFNKKKMYFNDSFSLNFNNYHFLKMQFSFFNVSNEERINYKFLKTLIERSVDLLLFQKINFLFFGIIKQKSSARHYKKNELFANLETNYLNIKKFYFKIFISKFKNFFLNLTSFDIENLNYSTKKSLLNFCFLNIINKGKNVFLFEILRNFFLLIFQKLYINFVIFNYSKFFFFNLNKFFFKNLFFFIPNKKITINNYFFKNNYLLLFFYNNNFYTIFNKQTNFIKPQFKKFCQIYSDFFIKEKNLQQLKLLINYTKKNFFDISNKINIFFFKLGILNKLNFSLFLNNFTNSNVFFKFNKFQKFDNKNFISYVFKNNFFKKNFNGFSNNKLKKQKIDYKKFLFFFRKRVFNFFFFIKAIKIH
jgi:hypothetical protein